MGLNLQVTAYYAPQFGMLRQRCVQGGEGAFIASLMRCRRWQSRGGKSNAYFAKTRDERYIVKSLSKVGLLALSWAATGLVHQVAGWH